MGLILISRHRYDLAFAFGPAEIISNGTLFANVGPSKRQPLLPVPLPTDRVGGRSRSAARSIYGERQTILRSWQGRIYALRDWDGGCVQRFRLMHVIYRPPSSPPTMMSSPLLRCVCVSVRGIFKSVRTWNFVSIQPDVSYKGKAGKF